MGMDDFRPRFCFLASWAGNRTWGGAGLKAAFFGKIWAGIVCLGIISLTLTGL